MILLAEWHYEPFLKGRIRIKEVDESFSKKKRKKEDECYSDLSKVA